MKSEDQTVGELHFHAIIPECIYVCSSLDMPAGQIVCAQVVPPANSTHLRCRSGKRRQLVTTASKILTRKAHPSRCSHGFGPLPLPHLGRFVGLRAMELARLHHRAAAHPAHHPGRAGTAESGLKWFG